MLGTQTQHLIDVAMFQAHQPAGPDPLVVKYRRSSLVASSQGTSFTWANRL